MEYDIVGMALLHENEHVYTWYSDGMVSSGHYTDLDRHQKRYPYTLPGTKTPYDIVGMGIASNNHVYTWYRDGTTSSGHSSDLGAYRAPYKFTLAYGQISPDDIVGMGIMRTATADHVITWYKDGTVSSGHSEDLDYFYTQPWHIDRGWSSLRRGEWRGLIDIAVDATGRTFAWWRDCTGEVYSNPRVGSAQGSKPFGWRQSVDR